MPKEQSNRDSYGVIEIEFIDGQKKEYEIAAHKGISNKLAKEAGQSGVLAFWNDFAGHGIPLNRIQEWKIRDAAEGEFEVVDND